MGEYLGVNTQAQHTETHKRIVMFQQGHFNELRNRKSSLKDQLAGQELLLQSLEDQPDDGNLDLRYTILTEAREEILKKLQLARLEGDEFLIYHGGREEILEIAEDGQIVLCHVKRTEKPDQLPTDMSSYPFFSVRVVDPDRRSTLSQSQNNSLRCALVYASKEDVYLLEDVQSVRVDEKYLSKERRIHIQWKNGRKSLSVSSPDPDELAEVLGTKLRHFNKNKITQVQCLKELWEQLRTPYDSENAEHEQMLSQFWSTIFPDVPLESRITGQWSKVGFQGKDPATDFRGGGILSLQCLCFFAKNYTTEVRRILNEGREYPFAVAGINISHELMTVFLHLNSDLMQLPPSHEGWNSPLLTFLCHANQLDTFFRVFCFLFLLLDAEWMAKGASYMQFPHILKNAKQQFRTILLRRPISLEQFENWVEQ